HALFGGAARLRLESRLNERENVRLVLTKRRSFGLSLVPVMFRQWWEDRPFQIRLDQHRMDVIFAADAACVAEPFGGDIDSRDNVLLCLTLGLRRAHVP